MNIQENISLKAFNTFGFDKKAKFFTEAHHHQDVLEAIQFAQNHNIDLFVLGGGSNILLTKDLDALVLKINIKGIEVIEENAKEVVVRVGAGEIWHDFVLKAIENNWAGVENLSLIPGTVGASPMQNIGAYGVEIKEVFESLEAIHRKTGKTHTFSHQECQFGYRESIFKKEQKGKFIITHVTFRLSKEPVFNTSYGAIAQTLEAMAPDEVNIKAISEAVIQIRQSKLPDPKKIGNAGSFFKNPTIPKEQFEELKAKHASIPGYENAEGVKVPAAWLIEQAGWKGKKIGQIGVHEFQPLVLVNYGQGEGEAIKELSIKIQQDVLNRFGVQLEPEVNFL